MIQAIAGRNVAHGSAVAEQIGTRAHSPRLQLVAGGLEVVLEVGSVQFVPRRFAEDVRGVLG